MCTLKKLLFAAGVSKIEIERSNEVVTIYLHVARPGVVIGKGGEQIEQYRKDVEKLIGKTVKLNIVEVRNPDMDRAAGGREHRRTAGEAYLSPPRYEERHGPRHRAGEGHQVQLRWSSGRPRIAGSEHYHEGPSPCRRCVPTSTTASLRLPPSAASA